MSRFLVEESSPTLKWRQPDDTMNLHELAPPKISLAEAEKTILNMFNALRLMVEDSALIFERLAPQEQEQDLVGLLEFAVQVDQT